MDAIHQQQLLHQMLELPNTVRSHFLNKNFQEEIFFEFGCSIQKKLGPVAGRIYLTETYLCFAANMLGFDIKVRTNNLN